MKLLKNSMLAIFLLSSSLTPAYATGVRCEDALDAIASASSPLNDPSVTVPLKPAKKSILAPGFTVGQDPKNLGKIKLQIFDERNLAWKALNAMIRGIVKYPLGINKLNQVGKRFLEDKSGRPYFERLADAFELKVSFEEKFLASIPKEGPVVLMSNHPMNGIDGIALAAMISKVRPDVKIVLTNFLEGFPEMLDNSILVNPYGGPAAKAENAIKKEQMAQHLTDGHALLIFPSGTVSLKDKLSDGYAMDPIWRTGVMQMLDRVPTAKVQNLFVVGQPSQAYQAATKLSGFTGLAMHIRELSRRVDSVVQILIGPTQKGQDILDRKDPQGSMNQFRALTYSMKMDEKPLAKNSTREMEEIPQKAFEGILEEMTQFGHVNFDFAPTKPEKSFKTFLVKGKDAPQLMKELGRLREITFRAAGEGSGKALDNDKYDADYYHLVCWDKENNRIAGAYRLGIVSELIKNQGLDGVYTREFFDYDQLLTNPEMAKYMLELGRAFVLPEYQGRSMAFPSLFGGIGQFLVAHPELKYLLGTVSISADYKVSSQFIISHTLMQNNASPYASITVAKTPAVYDTVLTAEDQAALINPIKTTTELDNLVKGIEGEKRRGVPQLINIYGDLNAQYLGFNFDRDFNTLDGLILVDMTKAPYEKLERYLGKEGAKSYMAHHTP